MYNNRLVDLNVCVINQHQIEKLQKVFWSSKIAALCSSFQQIIPQADHLTWRLVMCSVIDVHPYWQNFQLCEYSTGCMVVLNCSTHIPMLTSSILNSCDNNIVQWKTIQHFRRDTITLTFVTLSYGDENKKMRQTLSFCLEF